LHQANKRRQSFACLESHAEICQHDGECANRDVSRGILPRVDLPRVISSSCAIGYCAVTKREKHDRLRGANEA
jgi:hypothetical protein